MTTKLSSKTMIIFFLFFSYFIYNLFIFPFFLNIMYFH